MKRSCAIKRNGIKYFLLEMDCLHSSLSTQAINKISEAMEATEILTGRMEYKFLMRLWTS